MRRTATVLGILLVFACLWWLADMPVTSPDSADAATAVAAESPCVEEPSFEEARPLTLSPFIGDRNMQSSTGTAAEAAPCTIRLRLVNGVGKPVRGAHCSLVRYDEAEGEVQGSAWFHKRSREFNERKKLDATASSHEILGGNIDDGGSTQIYESHEPRSAAADVILADMRAKLKARRPPQQNLGSSVGFSGRTKVDGIVKVQTRPGWYEFTCYEAWRNSVRMGHSILGFVIAGETVEREIVMGVGPGLLVRVCDAEGRPVEGMSVSMSVYADAAREFPDAHFHRDTSREGTMHFEGVLPPRVQITIDPSLTRLWPKGPRRSLEEVPVEYRFGRVTIGATNASTLEPLDIQLLPAPHQLLVTIKLPQVEEKPQCFTLYSLERGQYVTSQVLTWTGEPQFNWPFTTPAHYPVPDTLLIMLDDGRMALAPLVGNGYRCSVDFGPLRPTALPQVRMDTGDVALPPLEFLTRMKDGTIIPLAVNWAWNPGAQALPILPYEQLPILVRQPNPKQQGEYLPFSNHGGAFEVPVEASQLNVWKIVV
ncbi:MAG: hypothetical protein EXS14_08775 [Planctomycetes bacterium]|nr:hypothetical protein [Planctomycetota bacterium]